MFSYIKGKITEIASNYIVVDHDGIGFEIHVGNPFSFKEMEEYTVYIYSYIREDEYTLYGFKTVEEKNLFLKLINVKGLGPKMALPMVSTGNTEALVDAINRENLLYLTKFPKVGDKVAKQIILDLKGKLTTEVELFNVNETEELVSALEGLGYKKADIKAILKKVDTTKPLEAQIKEALGLLLSR